MTHAHHGKSCVAALVLLPLVALSELVWAQPSEDDIAAEALFEEGKRLMEQGRPAEACAKFIDSDRLDPDMSTEYHLADCLEKIGRHASAWLLFRRVAAKARAAKDVAREERALERAAAVEPKVARLVIQVAPQPGRNKITIMRRRVDQPSESVVVYDDTALPVDQGEHEVEAVGEGKRSWKTRIRVSREGETQTLTVPVLKELPTTRSAPRKKPSPKDHPEQQRDEPLSGQSWAAVVAAGVGGAGVIAGVALAVTAKNRAEESNGHCDADDTTRCKQEGVELRDGAVDMGNAATGVFIASGIVLGAAGVLWLTAPDGPVSDAGTISATKVAVSKDGVFLEVGARW